MCHYKSYSYTEWSGNRIIPKKKPSKVKIKIQYNKESQKLVTNQKQKENELFR